MELNIQDTTGNYPRDQLMYCREVEIVPRRLKVRFLMLIDEDVGEVAPPEAVPPPEATSQVAALSAVEVD